MGFLSVSLFVFFEDKFRHVCRVEVGVSVEAAACCEGFEVEFELANIVYEVFVEGLVFHQGIKKRPRQVDCGGPKQRGYGLSIKMAGFGLGLPVLVVGTMRRWWLSGPAGRRYPTTAAPDSVAVVGRRGVCSSGRR